MKTLCIQIQPDRLTGVTEEHAVYLLAGIGDATSVVDEVTVTGGNDGGAYVNVRFQTSDVAELWRSIRKVIDGAAGAGSVVSNAVIVVCEGEHGWDDYLLLHHFDKSVIT